MTLVEGEELQRLWALVSELSSQLSANRQLCQSLQAQADELKGQALHTGTGYTLRRFNLDISKEKFESELEKLNSQLVVENQNLSHENKQINLLLREYEGTLESVMSKFRSFSHATQQHTLSLTSHYETLLANDSHQAESASLHASTSFSSSLAHLGGLVRLALREVEGEGVEPQDTDEGRDADPFEAEGYRVGSPSGIGPSEPAETGSTGQDSGRKSKAGYGSAPSRDPRWYGTGGYTGLQGDPEAEKAERALQARTEEERLRRENETLRELLRISADATPEIAREFGIEIAPPPTVATSWSSAGLNSGKLSLGKARGSRKSLVEAGATSKTAGEGLAEPEPAKGAVASKNSATKSASPEPLVPASPEAPVPLSLPPRSSSPVMAESAVSGLMSEDDPISPSKAAPQQGEGAGAGEPTQLMMSSDEVGKGKDASEAGASPANNGESAVMEDEEAAEAAKDTLAEDKAESADTGLGLRLEEGGVAEERPEATEVEEKAALRERILDEAEETLSETAKEGLLSP